MSERNVVETLRELGPEKVVDGSELCPCCDGLSPGISADGETIVHCPVCHDRNVVTVADTEPLAGRDTQAKRGWAGSRLDELD